MGVVLPPAEPAPFVPVLAWPEPEPDEEETGGLLGADGLCGHGTTWICTWPALGAEGMPTWLEGAVAGDDGLGPGHATKRIELGLPLGWLTPTCPDGAGAVYAPP